MKREIRVLLIDTCGWITSLSVVIFFFTLWLFSYNNVEESLKEAWTTTFTALSAFTTIGAAIIAASLFNDWRVQQQHQNTIQFGLYVYDTFTLLDRHLRELDADLFNLNENKDFINTETDEYIEVIDTLEERSNELIKLHSKFEETYINYCIVSGKEDRIRPDLDGLSDDIYKYAELLDDIIFETDIDKIYNNISKLTSEPLSDIGTKIYNFHIKSFFGEIHLK